MDVEISSPVVRNDVVDRRELHLARDVGRGRGVGVVPVDVEAFERRQHRHEVQQLERLRAERMLAVELEHLQLPLLEADAVVAQLLTRCLLEVGVVAQRERSFVLGVAQEDAGRLDLVLVRVVDAERERPGQRDLVRRAQGVVGVQLGKRLRAIDALAVAPLVLVVGERHGADRPVAGLVDIPGVAHGTLEGEVGVERLVGEVEIAVEARRELAVDLLRLGDRVEFTVAVQRLEDAGRADVALEVVDRRRDLRRQGAGAVVLAPLVVVAAGIGEAVVVAVGVITGADLEVEHQPVGDGTRADVDAAAAEGRRLVGRVAFLDGERFDDLGREEVQRDDVPRQVGRGHVGAVQRRAGVALTQPADIDELVAHHRDGGQPSQGERNRAVPDAADLLAAHDVRDDILVETFLDDVLGRRLLPAFDDDFLERGGGAAPGFRFLCLRGQCQGKRGGGRQRNCPADRISHGYVHGRPRSIWYTRARGVHGRAGDGNADRPAKPLTGQGGTVIQSGSSALSALRPNAQGAVQSLLASTAPILGQSSQGRRV